MCGCAIIPPQSFLAVYVQQFAAGACRATKGPTPGHHLTGPIAFFHASEKFLFSIIHDAKVAITLSLTPSASLR
jgi:hypothetical protein